MSTAGVIELQRDCQVILIPSGRAAILRTGAPVTIVQQLGTSFTVRTERGSLVRVEGADSDALGLDSPSPEALQAADAPFDVDQVLEVLRTVFDPEIPVNVVDLGLVYRCETVPLGSGRHRVEIDMSMTAPGCGMGDLLREDARAKVLALRSVADVSVELVWDPPWDTSRLSEAARLELGMW